MIYNVGFVYLLTRSMCRPTPSDVMMTHPTKIASHHVKKLSDKSYQKDIVPARVRILDINTVRQAFDANVQNYDEQINNKGGILNCC